MNGNWQDEAEVVKHIIVDYFSDLFQTSVNDARLTENERVNQSQISNMRIVSGYNIRRNKGGSI